MIFESSRFTEAWKKFLNRFCLKFEHKDLNFIFWNDSNSQICLVAFLSTKSKIF